jgi:mannobiose 2-epimerase
MHLMESFTVLCEASGAELHRRKLLEVTDLIAARMIDPATGCGLNQFDLAWNSVPALSLKRTWNAERFGEQPAQPTETTSYGHNTELAWLMRRALDTAGVATEPYRPAMRRLYDHAVAHGVDWEVGGIYRDGLRATGKAIVLEKEFWQHAEALVGFLDGYELFGDQRHLDAFNCLWRFSTRHLIIAGVGEWRTLLTCEGAAIDPNIGNAWKVSYHTGRAMIECERRLAALIARG